MSQDYNLVQGQGQEFEWKEKQWSSDAKSGGSVGTKPPENGKNYPPNGNLYGKHDGNPLEFPGIPFSGNGISGVPP
jgi:hypothetical protein